MIRVVILAVLICWVLVARAQAQSACGLYEMVKEKLTADYNESKRFRGMSGQGTLIEIWLSDEGSWTALSVRANGIACIVATGQDGFLITKALGEAL